MDIVFGSLATLIAAIFSYLVRGKKIFVPLPPVIANGIIVGIILNVTLQLPLIPSMLWVALGELVACYGLGLPLLSLLDKYGKNIFK